MNELASAVTYGSYTLCKHSAMPLGRRHIRRPLHPAWKSEAESSCLVALPFGISKIENVKLMVAPDTVSVLFPLFQEDPPDELRLLESPALVGQRRQRLVHLGSGRGES